MNVRLQFGCNRAIPESVTCAWGARWIFPADHLFDRQAMVGSDEDIAALQAWLNSEPTKGFMKARINANRAADEYIIDQRGDDTVVLYYDDTGVVVGNPQTSFGYLYVAAWLHNGDDNKQPNSAWVVIDKRIEEIVKQRKWYEAQDAAAKKRKRAHSNTRTYPRTFGSRW